MASSSLHTFLQTAKAPWAVLLPLKQSQNAASVVHPLEGFACRSIHGKKCGTSAGLFDEFARALSFPDYFGHNWDALEECLMDLEWLPAKGYVLVIVDAEHVLPDDEEEYETLLEILCDAGEHWAGRGRVVPFHALFVVSERNRQKRKRWDLPLVEETVSGARAAPGGRRAKRNARGR